MVDQRGLLGIRSAIGVAATLVAMAPTARAQEMEPRAYSQSPIGLTFLTTSYGLQAGDVSLDPSLPVANLHADINATAIGIARVIAFAGRQASVGVIAPYVWGSLNGDVLD